MSTTRIRCLPTTSLQVTLASSFPASFPVCSRAPLAFRPAEMNMSFYLSDRRSGYLSHRFPFPGDANLARKTTGFIRRRRARPGVSVRASLEQSRVSSNRKLIVANSAVTVVLAIANRVLYKLALVPMQQYPFFLAQLNTFGYVLIYFTALFVRYCLGIVTREMIGVPKWRFTIIGFLEALGVVTGMASAAVLPGPLIPILNQTFLVWQLVFSVFVLQRRYRFNQISGCLLVALGVVVAVSSGSSEDQMLSGIGFIWPTIMVASAAFQAGASVIKEFVFIDAAKRLEGKSLDIFVVNSFGSGFQALFVLLLLPFLSNLRGIPFASLPLYLKAGARCFLNTGANISGCEGAPLLPLLYIATNLAFNISLLNLVRISSAVVSSLTVMLSGPLFSPPPRKGVSSLSTTLEASVSFWNKLKNEEKTRGCAQIRLFLSVNISQFHCRCMYCRIHCRISPEEQA